MNIILGICALVLMVVLLWFVFDTRDKIKFIYDVYKNLVIIPRGNEVQSEEKKPDYKNIYPQGCTTGDDEDDG